MTAVVVGGIVALVVIVAYVVNRRMGRDRDLDGVWFPDGHWRGQR